MNRFGPIWVAILLVVALDTSRAQTNTGEQLGSAQGSGAVPAASGPDSTTQTPDDNPPISGLDQPSLQPAATSRSFLLPGVYVSESVDSNVGAATGNTAVHGVTRVLGNLLLEHIRGRSRSGLNYIGGGAFYAGFNRSNNQIHQLDADQRILWRTGQLAIRDAFSYLPEGSFGYGAFGGAGAFQGGLGTGFGNLGPGIIGGVLTGIFTPGQFGALGQEPRLTNTAVVDVTESLSPRSSITLAGGYGLVHFIDDTAGFINSREIMAQAGYSHQFTRKDQGALVYGYQDFQYPQFPGASFSTHIGNLLYGHRISGRLDFVVAAGPQVTVINNPLLGSIQRLTASGRFSLRYRFPRTTLDLSYHHRNTSGSGFFLGANTDTVRLSASRPLSRLWDARADVGYARNSQIQPGLGVVSARRYGYVYAGGAVHRQLSRSLGLFVSYQFNGLAFSECGTTGPCGRSQRHVASVGLAWHPRPIRLD